VVDGGREIIVNEERRPFVIHLRMLQEWLLCGGKFGAPILSSPLGTGSGAQIGNTVVSETAFGQGANAGAATTASASDHTHGTPPDPIPPHVANITAHNAHSLTGDVGGTIGNNQVNRIVTLPVNTAGANAGGVLTFRNTEWRVETPSAPVVKDVVRHPPNLPEYFIVAAGIVRQGGNRPPVYNNLAMKVIGNSQILLTFDKYQKPSGDLMYIVKPLLVANDAFTQGLRDATIAFQEFRDEGIVLFIANNGQIVEQGILAKMELMVEVSLFLK
jgi:hypothetical protein